MVLITAQHMLRTWEGFKVHHSRAVERIVHSSKTANRIVGLQQAFERRSEAKQHVAEIVRGACQLQPRVSGNADLQV